jgi:hypothetical protein
VYFLCFLPLVFLLPPHLIMPCVASTCCFDLIPHRCFVTLPHHCLASALPCTASSLPYVLLHHCLIVALCIASPLPHHCPAHCLTIVSSLPCTLPHHCLIIALCVVSPLLHRYPARYLATASSLPHFTTSCFIVLPTLVALLPCYIEIPFEPPHP